MVEQMDSLSRLDGALDFLRQMDANITIQGWRVFLAIVRTPGISQSALEDTVGISQSSISRHVLTLGKYAAFNVPGLGLIETEENPQNRREKLCNLTVKGKRVAEKLAALIEE